MILTDVARCSVPLRKLSLLLPYEIIPQHYKNVG